jgi:uncharacterized coiled-coil protein SlyX
VTGTSETRTLALRQQRRTESEHKHLAVKTAVVRCVARGLTESAAGVARAAGTTETFLYRHESQPCALCDEIFGGGPVSYYRAQMALIADSRDAGAERQGRVSAATLQAELANSRALAQRLRQQVHALEGRLGEVIGAQAQGGLPELARLAQDVDTPSERRIRELSQQVALLTNTVAERDEELAAVRRLNAELTRGLNSLNGPSRERKASP